MSKIKTAIRPMTEEEIEFCSYLKNVKLSDHNTDKYVLKPLLKFLAMTPPMIRESRTNTIYRMLYKYRRQLPPIANRHVQTFWKIVYAKMQPEKKRNTAKVKTLCQIFAAEEKRKQKLELAVPEATNL